jgi:tRNA uridine 5-carboxymethylaminomethyl modification enzyme
MAKVDNIRIPDALDFTGLTQLRMEAREKLGRLKPTNVGQASRVSGITPADIAVLVMYLK